MADTKLGNDCDNLKWLPQHRNGCHIIEWLTHKKMADTQLVNDGDSIKWLQEYKMADTT
jgi:hypothetical protein